MRLPLWLISLALVACAEPTHWDKPGASERVTEADMQECRLKARLAPPPRATPQMGSSESKAVLDVESQRARREAEDFQQCMREKGYSEKR